MAEGAIAAGAAPGGPAPIRRRDDLGRSGIALLVAGSILTMLFAVSLWSWRTFANSEGFADAAADALKEPAVAQALADQIVDILGEQAPTAQTTAALRPLLRGVVAEVVNSEAFRGLFHAGVREMHGAIVQGQRSRPLVRVDDSAQLVKDVLAETNPGMAEAISDSALPIAVELAQSPWIDLVMRVADLAGWLIIPFALGAAACFALAVRRATDRRRVLEVVGVCLIAVGAVVFAVLAALLNVVADVGQDPRQRTALRAVFWSTMHVLNVTAKVLIVIGAVVSFAAALAGRGPLTERIDALLDRGRATLADPRAKVVAAMVAIALGLLGLVWPLAMAEVIVRVLATGLVVLGTVWIFDLIGASSWVAGDRSGPPRRVTPRRLALGGTTGVATFSIVLLLGGMSFVRALRPADLDRLDINDVGCNRHVELCNRPIDQVAFAGTHNAMAATKEGFTFARHHGGLGAQLSSGVRAFLIDLHYGAPIKDVVRTDFATPAEQAESNSKLSPDQLATVQRTIAFLGGAADPQNRRVYLCHAYCEMGAIQAKKAFRLFHDFLRVNPNEVVILVLEDHVAAEDAIDVLESSGLADRAYSWLPGTPAPTLRQLIERKKNVVILAEYGGGARSWYHDAYGALLQDTPYGFRTLEELADPASCAVERGRRSASLLLLNHWLDTGGLADPNLTADANGMDALLGRAEACRERRGQTPTIVAVDFYTKGDLFRVVDRLNGVDGPTTVLATAGGP